MPTGEIRSTGKLGKKRYLVLGMDPGIASCGFALLDMNNQEILEMGSRLFDAPQEPKTKVSLAAKRRGFRSTRRNLDRTQVRLTRCLRLMQEDGLVPEDATKEYFHAIKGDKQPLRLRVEGLDRLLTDREWAIVLYSLCKRRGYIPHGEGAGSDSDEGRVLKAISSNTHAMEQSGSRTIGEYLFNLDASADESQRKSRNKGGDYDLCVTHQQLTDELKVLFEAQRGFGSIHASEDLMNEYLTIFDWQRDSAARDATTYELVGNCVYFPDEKRAARSTLTSELVSAYAALGNVTIQMPGGGKDGRKRTLTATERDRYLDVLFSPVPIKGNKECKVTFSRLREDLDLPAYAAFKGVRQDDEKNREVYVPKGWRLLRNTLSGQAGGSELVAKLRQDRDLADAVMEAAAYASSIGVFEDRLEELGLFEEEVELLCELPYSSRTLNGYGTRSKLALELLLDAFEEPEILTLTQAEDASGLLELRLSGHELERSDRLMPYAAWLEKTGRTNNNPVALRSMAQMRQVVNAVCRGWGVPDEIHVELDRELALPQKAKDNIRKSQDKNERENKRVAGDIAGMLGCTPDEVSKKLIRKYCLWEEQDYRDIYTGDKIEVERLIADDKYTEEDHILPYSRTGENSWNNKVLSLAKSNQDKRNRTPYEWMTSGEPGAPDWEEFSLRVQSNKKLSPRKRSFLLKEDLETSDQIEAEGRSDIAAEEQGELFLDRSMTDTAYMSREVCAYLSDCLAFPDDGLTVHVIPINGKATAWLRHHWGLNFGTSNSQTSTKGAADKKDRSDDRHHATDACVIAACTRSLVIKTAHLNEDFYLREQKAYREDDKVTLERIKAERKKALGDCMPWPSFADDVRERRRHVTPTRHVQHKGTGEAFEQTLYAYRGERADKKAILAANKDGKLKETISGNAVISDDDKSALIVSKMVCVRLWHDEKARRGRGRWYVDPIYVADIPVLKNGSYVPRCAVNGHGRKDWKPIPEQVLNQTPVVIYQQDALKVGDKVGRFDHLNISNVRWEIVDLLSDKNTLSDFPSIGELDNNLVPEVVREDVLGRCWDGLEWE